MPAARVAELEKVMGLTPNPDGLLVTSPLSPHVQPIAVCTYDWVHNVLQDGILSAELHAMMQARVVCREGLREFMQQEWFFPAAHASKGRALWRVFDDRRIAAESPNRIKASCSELLGIYGLVRNFVEHMVPETPENSTARRSFFGVCEVLDILLSAKFRTAPVADAWRQLEVAIARFIDLHRTAHGDRFVKPKHHWMLDVPRQIARDGVVLDAFVIERTHLAVKRVADMVQNTSTFEASVMASLTSEVWHSSREPGQHGLVGRVAALPGVAAAFVADRMSVYHVEISIGDVVFRGAVGGKVRACCQDGLVLTAFVDVLAVVDRISDHSSMCAETGRLVVWEATDLTLAVAWRDTAGGILVVR